MQKVGFALVLMLISMVSVANPLPAHEAFQLNVRQLDPNTLTLEWNIKPGYFLYKNRIKVLPSAPFHAELGPLHLPEAQSKTDKQGHTFLIYRDHLTLPIALLGKEPSENTLSLRYQGCSDEGFCYPPQSREIITTFNDALVLTNVALEPSDPAPNITTIKTKSEDPLTQLLLSRHWIIVALSFFGFGLLIAFTPCVLPMIPVLSGIIVGHGKNISTKKACLLSLSYVLSMSVTYSLIGAVIALMGHNLQIIMQSPWAIGIMGGIFALLALSMFDFYSLHLPLTWQNKWAQYSRPSSKGHYLNAAFMGAMSILVLSPCVTPPLIGVLSYVAQQGSIILGMLALFCLGLGMGTPLLLIGASAGSLLPKAGQWMNAVKTLFGFIFLATAIFVVSRIIPPWLNMCLWGALAILAGTNLITFNKTRSSREKFCQSLGIISLTYGLLILIGASLGYTNPLHPLTASQTSSMRHDVEVVTSLSQAQKRLMQAQGHPVMLDFYADWCTSCKILEATTLNDADVIAALHNYVVIKVDVTANNSDSKALLNHFRVIAPPTFILYNQQGHEFKRMVGEISKDHMLNGLGDMNGSTVDSKWR